MVLYLYFSNSEKLVDQWKDSKNRKNKQRIFKNLNDILLILLISVVRKSAVKNIYPENSTDVKKLL